MSVVETETVSSGPWYVKIATLLLQTSGPMALLAVGLTVFLCWAMWWRLDRVEANQVLIIKNQASIMKVLDGATINMSHFVSLHSELERERSRLMQVQIHLLREMCLNGAENAYQRGRCLQE